jgi:hypothetical protein
MDSSGRGLKWQGKAQGILQTKTSRCKEEVT